MSFLPKPLCPLGRTNHTLDFDSEQQQKTFSWLVTERKLQFS